MQKTQPALAAKQPILVETYGRISVARADATQQQSIDFARARGGRLLVNETEVIAELNRNPELARILETPGVYFFLGAKGTELSKHQRVDYQNNVFVPVKDESDWEDLPFKARGYVGKGDGPLFITVYRKDIFDIRLYLFGDTSPTFTAPLIVYRTDGPDKSAQRKTEPSKTTGSDAEFKQASDALGAEIARIAAAEKAGPWQTFTDNLRKLLRTPK